MPCVALPVEHDRRKRRVRPTCLGIAARDAVVEDDGARTEGQGERHEHQRSPPEQVPQKMLQTRHERRIDCEGGNSGRFPYETCMNEPKIPGVRDT